MKKFLILAAAAILGVCLSSCQKYDQEDSEPVNNTEPIPVNDIVSVKIDKTIYTLGVLSLGDDTHMIDNMISRYSSKKELKSSDILSSGDVLAFDASGLTLILGDKSKLESLKSAYEAGVIIFMNGGAESDFDKLCDALECYNPFESSTFYNLSDEVPLWILAGRMPLLGGMYCRLSPSNKDEATKSGEDEKAEFFSDYIQGLFCDMVAEDINNAVKPSVKSDPSTELTQLMGAKKVYIQGTQTQSAYIGSSDKWENRTNNYMLELDIWNAYSESEKRNYYYIHQEMTLAFGNLFFGECHDAAWKSYGWCGIDATTTFKHATNPSDVIFHKLSPGTTQVATTYSSSVGYSIGGSVSTEETGITGGISISNSTSYTIEDVTVTNLSVASSASSIASWKFALKEPDAHFHAFWWAQVAIDEGSLSGRSTFVSGSDFIFSVPQGYENKWYSAFSVHIRLSSFYDFISMEKNPIDKTKTFENNNIVLPVVK